MKTFALDLKEFMAIADSETDNNKTGVLIPDHCGKTEGMYTCSERQETLEVMVIFQSKREQGRKRVKRAAQEGLSSSHFTFKPLLRKASILLSHLLSVSVLVSDAMICDGSQRPGYTL